MNIFSWGKKRLLQTEPEEIAKEIINQINKHPIVVQNEILDIIVHKFFPNRHIHLNPRKKLSNRD